MANTFESANSHLLFNTVLKKLIENQFYIDSEGKIINEIDHRAIHQAIWLASILSNSKDEIHQQKAATFAKLLFLQNEHNMSLIQACYVILSRVGNLLATEYLKDLFDDPNNGIENKKFTRSFGAILDFEVSEQRSRNQINVGGNSVLTTSFQKKLWDDLQNKKYISISAPTSAGKSFIIQNYILEQFSKHEQYRVLYIVPTRALISQVSQDFNETIGNLNIHVKTAFVENKDEVSTPHVSRDIYVLTPERCLKILQQGWQQLYIPNVIFVDEIQNVENEGSRGVLLEYLLLEISLLWPKSKIIFAGPFVKNNDDLHSKLIGTTGDGLKTILSPVFQLKLFVRPSGDTNTISVGVKTNKKEDSQFKLKVDFNLQKALKKSKGDGLAFIVKHFASQQNIVYVSKANWAESYALLLSNLLESDNINTNDEVQELIEIIQDEIHPMYSLINCLRYNIAFHHGKLPDIVRNEIEDLFKAGKIKFLYCTSTLLQGVNLPAQKIFVSSPRKDTIELSAFEFGNLIGRAGRISNSLYGTIICIEDDIEEKNWANKYYDSDYEKEIITSAEAQLQYPIHNLIQNIDVSPSEYKSSHLYINSFLKHKYIKNVDELYSYLKNKNQTDQNADLIVKAIGRKLEDISIPFKLLRLNPTIDPELQDRLFKAIVNDGVEEWAINLNSTNQYLKMSREEAESLSMHKLSFFRQFERVFNKLNSIFKFSDEIFFKQKISDLTVGEMVYTANQWISNVRYSQLISETIDYYSNHPNPEKRINKNDYGDINSTISKFITINTQVTTFILVKYAKVLSDILSHLLTEEQKEKYPFALSLPSMLELGTNRLDVLKLISAGISRSVALKISEIPYFDKDNPIEWLKRQNTLPIKNIYIKYLKKRGYLSNNDIS